MDLSDLVQDWGGFEQLIEQLHQSGEVEVERDVILTGRSGTPRQIDVLIKHQQGLYKHFVVAECKHWKKKVSRLHVDALATTVREVGASRGVIFSTKGFQSGAVTQAAHEGIELFKVREPTDEEWGLPGRKIELFLQYSAVSLGHFSMPETYMIPLSHADSNSPLSLCLGGNISQTQIVSMHAEDRTLEELIFRYAHASADKAYEPKLVRFGDGFVGSMGCRSNVCINFKRPIEINHNGNLVIIKKITFDIGVRIDQSKMKIDRAEGYSFVLAVEDCIRRSVVTAIRKADETETHMKPVDISAIEPDDVYKNGSVAFIRLKGLHSFEEFENMEIGKMVPMPPLNPS